ncbi:M14-type cytosolic carboxypeptidase [Pseudomonas sp. zbq_18]|uniref:M14 family metallopeptidase n=1 Tax=Pseudomonadota TaxID=1224 RepID=UPI00370A714B
MQIRSDFDSGNIQVLDASDPARVRLAIRKDFASDHFQWFHFLAEGLTPGQTHRFTLENAPQSSYKNAWTGYRAVASYDGSDWFRVPTTYDEGGLHFELLAEHSSARFAYFEPYSRARHAQLLVKALALPNVELLACGSSLQGRELPLLHVRGTAAAPRKVWLIAQQHPGEHMAEWYMEGLIERLGRDDDELRALLAQADLYLMPNMNPDGAFLGNLRTNAAGQDLNRAWLAPSAERSPEVLFVQQQMAAIGVDCFLDIHGDEEIPHVFTAGCEGNPGFTPRLDALEQEFRQRLMAIGEFQVAQGYPRDQPGQANLALACNWVGQTYDCLAYTVEMPFKDHDDSPQPRTGWNGARSKRLAGDVLTVLAALAGKLR